MTLGSSVKETVEKHNRTWYDFFNRNHNADILIWPIVKSLNETSVLNWARFVAFCK